MITIQPTNAYYRDPPRAGMVVPYEYCRAWELRIGPLGLVWSRFFHAMRLWYPVVRFVRGERYHVGLRWSLCAHIPLCYRAVGLRWYK